MAADNPVLRRAMDHFRGREMQVIEVPEWGDDNAPLLVYARPLTMADKNVLARGSDGNDLGVFVDVIIMKAETADGEKLFTKMDKPQFMRGVDPEVITRVASAILRTDSVEDHLGNSEPTASD